MKKNAIFVILTVLFAMISACGSVDRKDDEKNANLKLLEENVESKDSAYLEGKELLEKKEFEKALESFKKSTVKDAEFYIAYSLNALGRTEEAKKAFETCINKGIQAVESLYNLALISYDAQNLEANLFYVEENMSEALKYYKEAAKIDPKSGDIQNAIFFVYIQTGEYENAWKMRDKVDKDASETVFAVMQLAEMTGDFIDGAKFAKKELLNNPQIRNQAKILFTKGGNLIEAIELAEKEEIPEGRYSLLDRSAAKGKAYILALNSEKNLFVSCETNPGNLIATEVSEQGIKVESIEEIIPFTDISAKLSEICGK